MASICFLVSLIVFLVSIAVPMSFSQTDTAPPPSSNSCNGIYVAYTHTAGSKLRPYVPSTPSKQPYRFESTITLLNNGREELKSWRVFVGFQHNEILVSASNAVLADGGDLPGEVGDGAVLAGSGSANLKTAIETAGDATQMGATIDLVGTVFGVGSPSVPMPKNISLANDGFKCPKVTMQGKNQMYTCCIKDANATSNVTVADEFLPLQKGDLTIMYDITKTYGSNYWAQVTIENHHSLGRLDDWRLSWLWMRDEFIYAMKGAYPSVVDSNDCIFGKQGQYYQSMDFSTVLNCERRPTIIDLPLTMANETKLGKIPHCCRDGLILPKWMDPSKSVSAFQVNVFKMAPDLNSSALSPPQSFQIKGTLNPNYKCGPPVRVSPSQFEDPSGLPSNTTAIASWQVACNITRSVKTPPRCCVSFSAYYNESVIPCRTCACGCPENSTKTCSATAPALLLPTEASLRPFENRSALAIAWAELKHRTVPKPLPCGDNCGVSMNWHLYTDYTGGWSARITLFNWEDNITFVDWFAAVQMNKAASGFEKLYSFNGTTVTDVKNTIFMQGLSGLNYLVAEADGATATALRVPGKQQSVISFTKKGISGMNLTSGDGFPAKVYFNGEECMLPKVLPISSGHRVSMTTIAIFSTFIMPLFLMFMQY